MYNICNIQRRERQKKKIKMIKIMLFKTICHTVNDVSG